LSETVIESIAVHRNTEQKQYWHRVYRDRGLPDFRVESAFPRKASEDGNGAGEPKQNQSRSGEIH
jgi:hypothetical protein